MRIVILTGAGVSVASGLKTFRGASGIYNDADVARLSHVSALRQDPDAVWKFWGSIREQALAAQPNAAHLSIAAAQQRLGPDDSLTVITMNVDGLQQRAGSTDVIELHGSLLHSRCIGDGERNVDAASHQTGAPTCSCGAALRPDIVLFGELLPLSAWQRARHASRYADVFIAAGTSNSVLPASALVKKPFYKGARTFFLNPEIPSDLRYFNAKIKGAAEELLPSLLERLLA